ncbi:MAG: NAD(P)H-quinone oxidoreductase [Herpetosiphon sp.]
MRAVVISQPGGPETLVIKDVDQPPSPQQGQVLINVKAAGVNRADLLQRAGRYPPPSGIRPDIPGLEFAGIIASVGSDCGEWQPGDRVFGLVGGAAQAEYLLTNAAELAHVPPNLDWETAAAVPEVFITAYDALKQGGIAAGKRVLIHAAGSGVATAAIQLVRAAGAIPYGTARTAAKLDQARSLGLAGAYLHTEAATWVDQLKADTDGSGADIIIDFVGGPLIGANLQALALRGVIVVVGTLGSAQGALDLGLLMGKRASIIGTLLRSRPAVEKATLTATWTRDVVPSLASGALKPIVDRTFPMDAVADAHRYMEKNMNFGKILLAIN